MKQSKPSFGGNSMFPAEGFLKLAQDPRTKDLINDQQFMSLLMECQRDPQKLMYVILIIMNIILVFYKTSYCEKIK